MTYTGFFITAAVFLSFGFWIGYFFNRMTKGRKSDVKQFASQTFTREEGEEPEEGEKTSRRPESGGSSRPGLRDVARMWREENSSTLVAEVGGLLLEKGSELGPKQHATLSLLLVDLQDWIGLDVRVDQTAASGSPEARAKAPPASEAASRREQAAPPPAKASARFSPIDMFTKALQADVRLPSPPGLVNIVEQINEVLQEMLEGTPLEARAVRLMETPDSGMVVYVGLDKYDAIEQVPDSEIQAVIRSAVTEWERRVGGEESS